MNADLRMNKGCFVGAMLIFATFTNAAENQIRQIQIRQIQNLQNQNQDQNQDQNVENQIQNQNLQNHFVRLFDGSALHGKMVLLSPNGGLLWEYQNAFQPIRFAFSSLASIRFNPTKHWQGARQSQCRFRFTNGDAIYGKILAMDERFIDMETWFGGTLRAAREKVQSIALLQNGYRVLYEGPNSMEEWIRGRSPNEWTYQDGVLNVEGRGVIGKDVGIDASASLAFDLNWQGTFQLILTMHAETLDRYDYSKGAYVFSLNPQFASFQRIQPGAGVMTLGQVRLTNWVNQTRARFDVRTHREKARFALWIDGKRLGTWKDSRGFIAKGKGISFSSQTSRSAFSISQILLTEWDGHFESDFKIDDEDVSDGLLLINQDRPKGIVKDIIQDKLNFNLRHQLSVKIPLERIMQIRLRSPQKQPEPFAENAIRVQIAGGGTLSFVLNRWSESIIEGISPTFGLLHLDPECIRGVELNLERHRLMQRSGQEAPEDIWDFETKTK